MGCILVPLYKTGKEDMVSKYKSLHDIPVRDIDGKALDRLGLYTDNIRAILVVNVASK
jgi:glutathione peroxidase-family protein